MELGEVSTPGVLNPLTDIPLENNPLEEFSQELDNELSYKLAKKRVKEARIRRNSESPEMLVFNQNNDELF
jgi:hypothetical protein